MYIHIPHLYIHKHIHTCTHTHTLTHAPTIETTSLSQKPAWYLWLTAHNASIGEAHRLLSCFTAWLDGSARSSTVGSLSVYKKFKKALKVAASQSSIVMTLEADSRMPEFSCFLSTSDLAQRTWECAWITSPCSLKSTSLQLASSSRACVSRHRVGSGTSTTDLAKDWEE